MSGSSPTSPEQLQVLYEIALSIGQGETLSDVAKTALSSYLRRLNCSAGGIFERRPDDRSPEYQLVEGIPTQPACNEAFDAATRHLRHDTEDEEAAFREDLPLAAGHGTAEYYIFDLPGFGVLVIIKSGAPLAPGTIAALEPLNQKLADACHNRRVKQRARRTRETLRTVLDTIPQEVFVKDGDGRYTLANEAAAAAYGVRIEELEGSTDADHARAGAERDVRATDARVIESGKPLRIEDERIADADGRERTITTDIVPLDLTDEQERRALVVAADTTARTEREAELRQTQAELEAANRDLESKRARIRTLLDDAPDGITVHTADGDILEVNQTQVDILGYDRETLLEMNIDDIAVDITREELAEIFTGMAVGDTVEAVATHRRADGTTLPVEVWVSKVGIDGAEPEFIALDRDISERVEREDRLERTNTILRTVLDSLPAGVLVEDPDRNILTVNQRLLDMFGMDVSSEALVGVDCETAAEDLKHTFAEPEQFVTRINHLIETRTQIRTEPLRLADGRQLERDYVPYELPDGSASLWMYRDITEQAQRESDLQEARTQLRQSNEELEQFAYAASHDLKEPLRSVGNYLTLLDHMYEEGQTFDAQAETLIENAVGATVRMQSMINALLQYSRVDSYGGNLEATSLDDVVEKSELNLTVRIDDTGSTVTTEPLPEVDGDRRLLIQLFQNLIDNGLKYNESPNPRVSVVPGEPVTEIDTPEQVAPNSDEAWHHVRVEDNGIGMNAERAGHAFDVFERLGRTDYDGTGMGLTLCQRIVEYHDGAIWIESSPGDGTVVHVCLPAV